LARHFYFHADIADVGMLRQAAGAESVFRNTFFGKQLEKELESAYVIGGCFRQIRLRRADRLPNPLISLNLPDPPSL